MIFQGLEDFLKRSGCKLIFLMAEEASYSGKELEYKYVNTLCEKLVHFKDERDTAGENIEPLELANALIRLMPCISIVNIFGNMLFSPFVQRFKVN